MRVGVVTFPGSCDDRDARAAVASMGASRWLSGTATTTCARWTPWCSRTTHSRQSRGTPPGAGPQPSAGEGIDGGSTEGRQRWVPSRVVAPVVTAWPIASAIYAPEQPVGSPPGPFGTAAIPGESPGPGRLPPERLHDLGRLDVGADHLEQPGSGAGVDYQPGEQGAPQPALADDPIGAGPGRHDPHPKDLGCRHRQHWGPVTAIPTSTRCSGHRGAGVIPRRPGC